MILHVVTLSSRAKVLLLEDDPDRLRWFRQRLPAGLFHTSSADEAIQKIATSEPFDVMFLDHDLSIADQSYRLRENHEFNSGSKFAQSFVEHGFVANSIVIHSWNPGGAVNMAHIFEQYGAKAAYLPFGTFEIRVFPQ